MSSATTHPTYDVDNIEHECDDEETIFSLHNITRKICSMTVFQTRSDSSTMKNLERSDIDPGKSDVPLAKTFQSSSQHSDVSLSGLSERWNISLAQATTTLKNTTQKFLCSTILPLSRRYRTDRFFDQKTLLGKWSTDTLDGRYKSIEGNQYAQVFANKGYFF